jgi:hypothetical protein
MESKFEINKFYKMIHIGKFLMQDAGKFAKKQLDKLDR